MRPVKKMCGVFREGVAVKYAQIASMRHSHSVSAMCRLLGVSESGFHAWRTRPMSARAAEEMSLETHIKAAHRRTRETCGAERLQAELADNGVEVGVHRIKRICRDSAK